MMNHQQAMAMGLTFIPVILIGIYKFSIFHSGKIVARHQVWSENDRKNAPRGTAGGLFQDMKAVVLAGHAPAHVERMVTRQSPPHYLRADQGPLRFQFCHLSSSAKYDGLTAGLALRGAEDHQPVFDIPPKVMLVRGGIPVWGGMRRGLLQRSFFTLTEGVVPRSANYILTATFDPAGHYNSLLDIVVRQGRKQENKLVTVFLGAVCVCGIIWGSIAQGD